VFPDKSGQAVRAKAVRTLVAKKIATKTRRRKRHTKISKLFVIGNQYVGKLLQKIAFSWNLLTPLIIFKGVIRTF
jgi:hypothetical protein